MTISKRTYILSVASLLILGAVLAFVTTSSSSAGTSAPFSVSVSTIPNPWLQYVTGVNPGGNLQFVGADYGWRLDGREGQPYEFGFLSSGPSFSTMTWPGTAISATTDGGSTWTNLLSVPGGLWGFDLVNSSVGLAIGITSIYETSDGGASWSVVPEPSNTQLVAAQFWSQSTGLGVSTDGDLWSTNDAGITWQTLTAPTAITSICSISTSDYLVTDPSGNIFQSIDSGQSWNEVFQQSDLAKYPGATGGAWSSLSCNSSGQAVADSIYPLVHGNTETYDVAVDDDGAWQVARPLEPQSAIGTSTGSAQSAWPTVLSATTIATNGDIYAIGEDSNGSEVSTLSLGAGDLAATSIGTISAATVGSTYSGQSPDSSVAFANGLVASPQNLMIELTINTTFDGGGTYTPFYTISTGSTDATASWTDVVSGAFTAQTPVVPLNQELRPVRNQSLAR